MTNTGTVTFSADAVVLVSAWRQDQPSEASLTPAGRVIAPDGTAVLEGVWDAPLFGRVTARPIVEATVGERPAVSFTGDPITFWLVPWIHLAVALAVLLTAIAAWAATRERRRTWREHRREEREMLRDFRRERRLRQDGGEQPGAGGHEPEPPRPRTPTLSG